MTRVTDLCHPETVRVAASHRAEARKIAAELAAIAGTGLVLPGSITERRTRCGHRNCACHADPPRLHGPYWQWTRKVAARTVCRWLSHGQRHDYQAWIDNDRRLHDLLARLEALGAAALGAVCACPVVFCAPCWFAACCRCRCWCVRCAVLVAEAGVRGRGMARVRAAGWRRRAR